MQSSEQTQPLPFPSPQVVFGKALTRQLPDGLLEARLHGETEYDNFLLEAATYAERRTQEQLTRNAMLVYLDRGALPEIIVLVLAQKGRQRLSHGRRLRSRRGLTTASFKWRVVELWNVPAVIQVLARLKYNNPKVFAILGGKKIMIESPFIDELISEARHESILEVLKTRFGDVTPELENRIRSVIDKEALTQMTRTAAACKDIEAFEKSLG